MLPIRVFLAVHGKPVVDKYVIIDDGVKLCDLVGTALHSLGFGHLAKGAQGFIQIGNWKPLSFEQIANNQDESATKLLKPILHDAVLKVAVQQNRTDASPQARIDLAEMPAAKENDQSHDRSDTKLTDSDTGDEDEGAKSAKDRDSDGTTDVELEVSSPVSSSEHALSPELLLQQFLGNQQPLFDVPASAPAGFRDLKMTRSPSSGDRRYSPMTGSLKPCFNTIYEVPMLQGWYNAHKFPGKAQCQLYADELNSLSHRQTSPALSWQTVSNWFKNRRRQDRRKGVMPTVTAGILQ